MSRVVYMRLYAHPISWIADYYRRRARCGQLSKRCSEPGKQCLLPGRRTVRANTAHAQPLCARTFVSGNNGTLRNHGGLTEGIIGSTGSPVSVWLGRTCGVMSMKKPSTKPVESAAFIPSTLHRERGAREGEGGRMSPEILYERGFGYRA
eukprot:SAG31_NODE_4874_length_2892_cov_3.716076_2_plen_150_part_00